MCEKSEHAHARGLFDDTRDALHHSSESQRRSTIVGLPYMVNFVGLNIENDKNIHCHETDEYNVHAVSCCSVSPSPKRYPNFRQTSAPSSIHMNDPHPLPLGCEN